MKLKGTDLLYGEVMTSSSAEGKTAVVNRYTSGYSSCNNSSTLVPTPDPVPTHREVPLDYSVSTLKRLYLFLSSSRSYLPPWSAE